MELKDILRDLRLKNNLTLEELAERLNKYDGVDISKGTISRWENGTREPKNTYVSAYAKEFNIDLNILYGLEKYRDHTESLKDENTSFKEMVVMGFDGLDVSKMTDEERESYYNDLINMMNMVNLKHKDKQKGK